MRLETRCVRRELRARSVIGNLGTLGDDDDVNLGWLIGRPTMVSGLLAILTPLLGKYALAPLFRRYLEPKFPKSRKRHVINVVFMILVLCVFLSITGFGGTSVLYGSFLAGAFLTYLPTKHPTGPFVVPSREDAEEAEARSMRSNPMTGEPEISPSFMHTFEKYFLDVVKYILQPIFFASIGFAIPFVDLWTAEAVWKGLVYTILMLIGKVVVGLVIPAATILQRPRDTSVRDCLTETFWPAMLLGCAMVARGEIGLLIVQIGLNNTPYLSKDAFITAVWAIVLNTILGPVAVGFILKYKARAIANGLWGLDFENDTGTVQMSRAATVVAADEAEEMKEGAMSKAATAATSPRSGRSLDIEAAPVGRISGQGT